MRVYLCLSVAVCARGVAVKIKLSLIIFLRMSFISKTAIR